MATISLLATWEIMINLARLPRSFSSRTTWMPSIPGISRSHSTRSGSAARIFPKSAGPPPLSPHTVPRSFPSTISSRMLITEMSSSTI